MTIPILTDSLVEFPQPTTYPLGNGKFRLKKAYTYEFMDKVDGLLKRITVPLAFVFDMASIPQWLWSILGITPDGLHRAGALIHDFLTRHAGVMPLGSVQVFVDGKWFNYEKPFKRKQADKLFLRILEQAEVNLIRSTSFYWAVRAFGWISWRKNSG